MRPGGAGYAKSNYVRSVVMSIMKSKFGSLPCGAQVDQYTLTNKGGASVSILNYGGIVTKILVPDKDGKLGDVALGYDTIDGYVENPGHLGALIGRVGNRINRGKCVLNGAALELAANANGHHLHGGTVGFGKKIWDATPAEGAGEDSLILTYTSADGEENYPGELKVKVTYTWTDLCELKIHYEAVSDKDTLCNLTNHSYFNLEGEGSGPVDDHIMQIHADAVTAADKDLIPTGELLPVMGTPFDLRTGLPIGEGLKFIETDEQMKFGGGYDHNFVPNGTGMRKIAVVTAPVSGRAMDVYSDKVGVQFYTANMLKTKLPGKSGKPYGPRGGFCLETQYHPDSINHPNFPDSVLRAGAKYDFTTIYAFR